MQTRNSSPPQAPDVPEAPPEASGKAQWSDADEIALIEYIAEHKSEAGEGMKFKASFWTGAAKKMVSHSAMGGVKTPQGCSSKWDRVCTTFIHAIFEPTDTFYPAQEVIQCRRYTQGKYIWI